MYPLPPYARRIEYLESTGTQWIDTGVAASGVGRVMARFIPLQYGVYDTVMGARNGSSNVGSFQMRTGTNSSSGRVIFNGNTSSNVISFVYDAENTVNIPFGSRDVTVNGTAVRLSVAQAVTVGLTLTIFALHTSESAVDARSATRLLSMVFFDRDSITVRSFVPCRILDVGYLWDEVEGRLYGNSGTGDFVLGPDVREGVVPTRLNPFGVGRRQEEVRGVEYIEANTNDGTAQYIDTLVPVTTDTIVEAEWTQTGTAIQQRLFGVNDGGEKRFALYNNNNGKWAVNTGTSAGGAMQDVTLGDWSGSFDLGTGVCVLNGTSLSNGGTPFSSDNTIPIFARKNAGTIVYTDYPATMQLKSFKITQGGKTAFDGTPVRIGSVGYLLDKVSGQLFGNLGTGNFVLGSDV